MMSPKQADLWAIRTVTSQLIMRAGVGCLLAGGIPIWIAGDGRGTSSAILVGVGTTIFAFPFIVLLGVAALHVAQPRRRRRAAFVMSSHEAFAYPPFQRLSTLAAGVALLLGTVAGLLVA